ncbi:hypothetical protein GQ457_13G019290 [Hibiscus cannabinus]
MASNKSFVGFEKGRTITCPLFKGDSYFQWCHQMEFFIKTIDFDLWEIIEDGYVKVPKKKNRSSKDMRKVKLNAKAMHTLLCGLNDDISKKVSSCKSAKEMWEKLEKLYKKEEVKGAKVDDKSAHKELEVFSNSSISFSYSFDKLQDTYDELVLEFENHILKNKKILSNLKNQNDLISKTNYELEAKLKEFEQKNVSLQNLLQSLEKDHQKEVDDLKKEKDLISKELEKKNKWKMF